MFQLLIFFSVCGAITAIPANLGLGIAGGKVVKITDHPYEVSIERDDKTFCAGSIIGDKAVLTTAACASYGKEEQMLVRFGSDTRGLGGKMNNINTIVKHDDYNPVSLENNIAIIKVTDAFTAEGVKIALSDKAENSKPGTQGTVSGWGNLDAITATHDLHEITVKVIDADTCKSMMKAPGDKEFCAGDLNSGKATCFGDSGAPFVIKVDNKATLVGFRSWRVNYCGSDRPDVYVDVQSYIDWINKNIK